MKDACKSYASAVKEGLSVAARAHVPAGNRAVRLFFRKSASWLKRNQDRLPFRLPEHVSVPFRHRSECAARERHGCRESIRGSVFKAFPDSGAARLHRGYADSSNRALSNTHVNVEPSPGSLSIRSSASCRFSTCLTMDKPRPVPPVARERLDAFLGAAVQGALRALAQMGDPAARRARQSPRHRARRRRAPHRRIAVASSALNSIPPELNARRAT